MLSSLPLSFDALVMATSVNRLYFDELLSAVLENIEYRKKNSASAGMNATLQAHVTLICKQKNRFSKFYNKNGRGSGVSGGRGFRGGRGGRGERRRGGHNHGMIFAIILGENMATV